MELHRSPEVMNPVDQVRAAIYDHIIKLQVDLGHLGVEKPSNADIAERLIRESIGGTAITRLLHNLLIVQYNREIPNQINKAGLVQNGGDFSCFVTSGATVARAYRAPIIDLQTMSHQCGLIAISYPSPGWLTAQNNRRLVKNGVMNLGPEILSGYIFTMPIFGMKANTKFFPELVDATAIDQYEIFIIKTKREPAEFQSFTYRSRIYYPPFDKRVNILTFDLSYKPKLSAANPHVHSFSYSNHGITTRK